MLLQKHDELVPSRIIAVRDSHESNVPRNLMRGLSATRVINGIAHVRYRQIRMFGKSDFCFLRLSASSG